MKLTKNQIHKIQSSLSCGRIYYDDIKAELVDHFASKVEDSMEEGSSFDKAFSEISKEINPSQFQRKLLLATHLGFLKNIASNMLKGSILLKSILLFAVWVVIINFFEYSPEVAERHVKTIFIGTTVGLALMGLWGGLLKNSKVVASGNTLWLMICISQFVLNLDLMVWLGLSPIVAICLITFFLSHLFIAGLSEVVFQTKRLKTA